MNPLSKATMNDVKRVQIFHTVNTRFARDDDEVGHPVEEFAKTTENYHRAEQKRNYNVHFTNEQL